MKQAQYAPSRPPKPRWNQPGGLSEALCYQPYAPRAADRAGWRPGRGAARAAGAALWLLWRVVTLPFRLLLALVELIGRLFGVALGFTIMVVGMALWAGPLFILGVPVFIIGLLLTLRCLG